MRTFLLLGSNLGNRLQNLLLAKNFIINKLGKILNESSIYETEPWKMPDEETWFLNQVIEVETELLPGEVLKMIKEYEAQNGRKDMPNRKTYESRVIDIDILFYDDEIINTEVLTIPHPLLHSRRFALLPMNDIAPGLVHPVLNKTIEELLELCPDKAEVRKMESFDMEMAIN
jgi:2-amino-4-hydroxy-6-hydroxymethyldihydropteridine diphosphokinase